MMPAVVSIAYYKQQKIENIQSEMFTEEILSRLYDSQIQYEISMQKTIYSNLLLYRGHSLWLKSPPLDFEVGA